MSLPEPPDIVSLVPPADLGELLLWRVWHPSGHVATADQARSYGPLARFDPHPTGPAAEHPGGPYAWYGSLLFDTSTLEALARPAGRAVVDICPGMRASLVRVDTTDVYDLTDEDLCEQLAADTRLGDDPCDPGYGTTQRWARHLHATANGARYYSARHRQANGHRHGINWGLWSPDAPTAVTHQHRLIDDALWPHAVMAFDAVGIAVAWIDSCPRC